MEKVLLELLNKISNFAQKMNIPEGVELTLESDGSGGAIDYATKEDIFEFQNIGELIIKLDED
jgi:hypothetical protein